METYINAVYNYLETPVPATALSIFRILLGFFLFVDTIIERGWSDESLYSDLQDAVDSKMCLFPLVDSPFLKMTPEKFALACSLQAFAAIFICIGLLYRLSCGVFLMSFLSIVLSNKLRWNNHSYLYAIVVTLLMTMAANQKYSIDSVIFRRFSNQIKSTVPYWNYLILQLQIAIVYTYAGLNKIDPDWLNGRSLPNLSEHWVFEGLKKLFPENDFVSFDFVIIRLGGLFIDLLAGIALFHRRTRLLALIFTSSFHLMNMAMFAIGVFPCVMLASGVLFLPNYTLPPPVSSQTCQPDRQPSCFRRYSTVILLIFHVLLQLFIPQCHSFFPGLMTWTKTGQYGFSWEMMLHEWNVAHITVNLKDKLTKEDYFIDPSKIVAGGNQRWAFHPDMIFQFSSCIKKIIRKDDSSFSSNADVEERFSLYIDLWISLNQRVHQRFVDPRADMFNVAWDPFTKPSWILPLIDTLPPLNTVNLLQVLDLKFSSPNVDKEKLEYLVFTDFPTFSLHHFIDPLLDNVDLFVLNGTVSVEFDRDDDNDDVVSSTSNEAKNGIVHLTVGDAAFAIPNGRFHTLTTLSSSPSLCLYTFKNTTLWEEIDTEENAGLKPDSEKAAPSPFSAISRLTSRLAKLYTKTNDGIKISERALRSVVFGTEFHLHK